jgi:hypothetical protein
MTQNKETKRQSWYFQDAQEEQRVQAAAILFQQFTEDNQDFK